MKSIVSEVFLDFYQIRLMFRDLIDCGSKEPRITGENIEGMKRYFYGKYKNEKSVFDVLVKSEFSEKFKKDIFDFFEDTFEKNRFFMVEDNKVIPNINTKDEFLKNVAIFSETLRMLLNGFVNQMKEENPEGVEDFIDLLNKDQNFTSLHNGFYYLNNFYFQIVEVLKKIMSQENKVTPEDQYELNSVRFMLGLIQSVEENYQQDNQQIKELLKQVLEVSKRVYLSYQLKEKEEVDALNKDLKELFVKIQHSAKESFLEWSESYRALLNKSFPEHKNV